MLKVDLPGRGIVALRHSAETDARFRPEGFLTGIRRDGCQSYVDGRVQQVSALIEVQRRFGGLAPRALLGGSLSIANTGELAIRIAFGDADDSRNWSSELWNGAFTVGLPRSFASAALQALMNRDDLPIPCGALVIEQAGFDPIESAGPVFEQAAIVLAHVLDAMARESNVEESIAQATESWE